MTWMPTSTIAASLAFTWTNWPHPGLLSWSAPNFRPLLAAMSRKMHPTRWRKRLQLPLDAFVTMRPVLHKVSRLRPTWMYLLLPAICTLLAIVLLVPPLSVHYLLTSPAPVRPPYAISDADILRLSNIAVQRLLFQPCDPLQSHTLIDDDSIYHTLVNVARIPPVFASRLAVPGRRKLLQRLTCGSNRLADYTSLPRVVIIDMQNGLGNRLRALGSALEFAFYTHRIPILLWAPDAHLNTTMANLFDSTTLSNLIVIDQPVPWPIDPFDIPASQNFSKTNTIPDAHLANSFRYYNLMSKDYGFSSPHLAPIENVPDKHIYIKTAYVVESHWVSDQLSNAFIQALRPSPAVRDLVKSVEDDTGGPQALGRMIGVHIRSRSIENDNFKVDYQCEYSITSAATTDSWRKMSTPSQFIPEMRQIRSEWPSVVHKSQAMQRVEPMRASDTHNGQSLIAVNVTIPPRFFVSTDSTETLQQLYSVFGRDEIVSLPRNCDDRGSACVLYAFADMILLSRTGAMLGSGWSSFSEAALRLRKRPAGYSAVWKNGYVYRLSGQDFGGPTMWERIRRRVGAWLEVGNAATKGRDERVAQEERRRLCRQRIKKVE